MTVDRVLDTNVFVVSLLAEAILNEEERRQRPLAADYVADMGRGECVVHLPTIAIVEIVGVCRRKAGELATAVALRRTLEELVGRGAIRLYEFGEARMKAAVDLVTVHNLSRRRSLSAPDAIFIALAEELGCELVTFEKYFSQVSKRAMIPA